MDDFKLVYIKSDEDKILLDNLKDIMKAYEMKLIKTEGERYTFDRDGSYSREFVIYKTLNGWTAIHDEDEVQAESMCQELSELSHSFILCIGIYNEDLLFYTAFNDGVQVDQYMSTMEYYEYQVDDEVIDFYKGNSKVFNEVISDEHTDELQLILDKCREGDIETEKAYTEIQQILGVVEVEVNDTEEVDEQETAVQEEEQIIEIGDIFYVDFNSINIKIDSQQMVIEAVRSIASETGYTEVESFDRVPEEKKGFFKKILSSVTESRRIHFYISPLSDGWVTLVGELELLYGEEPTQWEFLHIEDRLSQIFQRKVINIFGDSERWGFKVFRDGRLEYGYSSDIEFTATDETLELFEGIEQEILSDILDSQAQSPEEIDSTLEKFCSMLSIRNYKVNIPMDYTEEEYKVRVLDKLPDGKGFVELRFIKKR